MNDVWILVQDLAVPIRTVVSYLIVQFVLVELVSLVIHFLDVVQFQVRFVT